MFKRYGKKLISIVMAFLIIPMSIVSANDYSSKKGKRDVFFERLQALLNSDRNSTWTAERNEISDMSIVEFQNTLGVLPYTYRDSSIKETIFSSDVIERLRGAFEVPGSSVKNQGGCGSCYAHAANSVFESWLISQGKGELDLSEQDLLMKAKARAAEQNKSVGGCSGFTLGETMGMLKEKGVTIESKYPYKASDKGENVDISTPNYKISNFGKVKGDVEQVKAALEEKGQLVAAFIVYNDFRNYKSGVYKYTTGAQLGGHAIVIVGFDDAKQAFKVKNSWGPGWGENGYFWIGYDQMDNCVRFGNTSGGCFYITR